MTKAELENEHRKMKAALELIVEMGLRVDHRTDADHEVRAPYLLGYVTSTAASGLGVDLVDLVERFKAAPVDAAVAAAERR